VELTKATSVDLGTERHLCWHGYVALPFHDRGTKRIYAICRHVGLISNMDRLYQRGLGGCDSHEEVSGRDGDSLCWGFLGL
jgi:hypothetical protein